MRAHPDQLMEVRVGPAIRENSGRQGKIVNGNCRRILIKAAAGVN
jgi:hypothetical protein